MNEERKMSFFLPPISPVKDERGRTVKPATLVPSKEITLREVWKLITGSDRLRQLTEEVRLAARGDEESAYRAMKQSMLPYVTPAGLFSYRRSDSLITPSGLVVLDIDHLASDEETEKMRHELFNDPFLMPELVFASPSGRGVKAFVPYDLNRLPDVKQNAAECVTWLMTYVTLMYDNGTRGGNLPEQLPAKRAGDARKGVDTSGKDLVRSCFLSYDEGALMREPAAQHETGKTLHETTPG